MPEDGKDSFGIPTEKPRDFSPRGQAAILVVDDSELMRGYVSELLAKAGHSVSVAGGLGEAVDRYSADRPTHVLMDFILGEGLTGLDVLSAIFALAGQDRPRAAILTQGELAKVDRQKAESHGIEVIQKPVRGREAEFLAVVGGWLKRGAKES